MAFLPMGLTLIIPLRNSTKVPLLTVSASEAMHPTEGASPFNGNVQIRNVMQDKVHEDLVFILANIIDERWRRKLFSEFVRRQSILCKRVVEFINGCKKIYELRGGWRVCVTPKADLVHHQRTIARRSSRNLSLPRTQ